MTELELRLEAMRMAARPGVEDVVAEAERIMQFLAPPAITPVPEVTGKRKPYSRDLHADIERAVELMRNGMSRNAAGRALGYRKGTTVIEVAKRLGIELPPLNMANRRVAHAARLAAVTRAAAAS